MTDAFTDELFPPTPVEAGRVIFPVSRLVCDVERFPSDEDEPMATRGMGVIYTRMTAARTEAWLDEFRRELVAFPASHRTAQSTPSAARRLKARSDARRNLIHKRPLSAEASWL